MSMAEFFCGKIIKVNKNLLLEVLMRIFVILGMFCIFGVSAEPAAPIQDCLQACKQSYEACERYQVADPQVMQQRKCKQAYNGCVAKCNRNNSQCSVKCQNQNEANLRKCFTIKDQKKKKQCIVDAATVLKQCLANCNLRK